MKIIFIFKKYVLNNESSDDLEGFKIPSGTLLLLVENAIKHKIISQENPLHVVIKNDLNFLYVINNNFLLKYLCTRNDSGFLPKKKWGNKRVTLF